MVYSVKKAWILQNVINSIFIKGYINGEKKHGYTKHEIYCTFKDT